MNERDLIRLYRFLFETGGTAEERQALADAMLRYNRTRTNKRGGLFGVTAAERRLIVSLWNRWASR